MASGRVARHNMAGGTDSPSVLAICRTRKELQSSRHLPLLVFTKSIMMKQTNVLALAVVIVVAVVPSIAVAFVVLPPYAAVAAAAARLNYHPNGDLGGGGYPPMTGREASHLAPESSAFPPPMGLEGQQLPDGHDDPLAATYDRALDCANNFGMCEIDELLDLSEELDEYMDSCYVEDGPEACENEIGVSSVCVQRSSLPSIICVIFNYRQLFCMQCTFQFFSSSHHLFCCYIIILYHPIGSSRTVRGTTCTG